MSLQRRVKAGELWAGCKQLCHGAACLWAFRYHHLPLLGWQSLKLHGRQRWKAQNFHSLQPSVSQSASELNKLHGECDLPCLPIYSSLDSKSIVFDLVYSSYKHVAFFSAVVFSSNHVLHTSAVRTLSSGYKPTGSLNFTLQSLPKCQLLLTSDCC